MSRSTMVRAMRWFDAKTNPPAKSGVYLCVDDFWHGKMKPRCKVLKYTTSLASVDAYDFSDEDRPGWYDYDGETGYYEVDSVTHWMPLPYLPEEFKRK